MREKKYREREGKQEKRRNGEAVVRGEENEMEYGEVVKRRGREG